MRRHTRPPIGIVSDVMEFSPREGTKLALAHVGTYEISGIESTRDFTTILLPKDNSSNIDLKDIYKLVNENESLVIRWENGNNTHLGPTDRLLQYFRLTSRFHKDIVIWDDLSMPKHGVIENRPNSLYEFPRYSPAFVNIEEDYLRMYLQERQLVAFQIYNETRIVPLSDEIEILLAGERFYQCSDDCSYEIKIQRHFSKENWVHIEVNGVRILLQPGRKNRFS